MPSAEKEPAAETDTGAALEAKRQAEELSVGAVDSLPEGALA